MMPTAACAWRAAAARGSPNLGRVRHFAELPDAAGAAPELELLQLQLALEREKGAQALALEEAKAAQARGLWETLFGIKRETAQLLNFAAGGAFFVAS